MNCRELREYLYAFLDSELDSALSIEVQRHLEQCPECAREVEIEWAIKGKLSEALSHEPVDVEFDERTLQRWLEHEQTRRPSGRWRHRRSLKRFAAAAAIVAFIGIWFGVRGVSPRADAAPLTELLVADYTHFVKEGRPVQMVSSDRVALADWLRDKTSLDVRLPRLRNSSCVLVGGRKCEVNGRPAAYAVYDSEGTAASLIALDARHADLRGIPTTTHDGRLLWVQRWKGHTVLACQRDGLVYAAVSTLPEDRFLCLLNLPE